MKASKLCSIFALHLVGLGLLVTWTAWAGDVVPSFTISKAYQAIHPKDLAWDIQPPVFLTRLDAGEPTAQFKIRSDTNGLFVQMRQFRSSDQERLQQIEIFLSLDPDKSANYFRFVLEEAGALKKQFRREEGDFEKSVPMDWQHFAKLEQDSECHTIEIPFASLGRGTPEHGDVWGFNVKVNAQDADGKNVSSAWVAPLIASSTQTGSSTAKQSFGTIAFE